jgi:hypothetical protein
MDKYGFMRSLEGIDRYMINHIYNSNQIVSRRQAMKEIAEKGKRKLQQKLYHQRDIVEQYSH